jgi:hypothetical protein
MGMFDYVNYECTCPYCNENTSGFQSKDGDCLLEMLEPEDVEVFYTMCDYCDSWIEFKNMGNSEFKLIKDRR